MQKSSKTNGIEIQIQHWGENRKLSMKGNYVEYFPPSVDTGSNINIKVMKMNKMHVIHMLI